MKRELEIGDVFVCPSMMLSEWTSTHPTNVTCDKASAREDKQCDLWIDNVNLKSAAFVIVNITIDTDDCGSWEFFHARKLKVISPAKKNIAERYEYDDNGFIITFSQCPNFNCCVPPEKIRFLGKMRKEEKWYWKNTGRGERNEFSKN